MPRFSSATSAAQVQAHYDMLGPAPTLRIFDNYEPASITSPDQGNVLVEMTLPTVWAQVTGATLSNHVAWSGTAIATGLAYHYRMYDSNGVCHEQGYISDGSFNAPNITTGDTVQLPIGSYTLAHYVAPGGGA